MLNAHLDVLIERTLNLHVCAIYFIILLRLLKVMLLIYNQKLNGINLSHQKFE